MSTKSRTNSKEFDAGAYVRRAAELVRQRRAEGWTWREIGEACGTDPSWPGKFLSGAVGDPGIRRIGRVIERLR